MTSAAATAPEIGAITQGEMEEGEADDEVAADAAAEDPSDERPSGDPSGAPFGGCSGDPSPVALLVSVDISLTSRSMVGGARLGRAASGGDSICSGLSSTIAAVP
jgi:hypothetical protein